MHQWMRSCCVTLAISLNFTSGFQLREAKAQVKKSDTGVDSTALYAKLRRNTHVARAKLRRAEVELDSNNTLKAIALADSASNSVLIGIPLVPGHTNEDIRRALRLHDDAFLFLHRASRIHHEDVFESAGWFRYRRGTLGRKFEQDFLRWYRRTSSWIVTVEDLDKRGPYFDYSFLKGGSRRRIIKSITLSGRTLSVNLRANPDEMAKLYRSTGMIELKHPIKTLGEFKLLLVELWKQPKNHFLAEKWNDARNRYSEVDEIVLTLYFQGSTRGTETPIAKFGLSRSAAKAFDRSIHSVRDGIFQDLLKAKGTYWLHPDIPDMGTPRHLLR